MSFIIGIDPDTKAITMVGLEHQPVFFHRLQARGRRAEDRIEQLAASLFTLKIPRVNWVYIESPVMGVNVKALRDQAQVIGMIRYWLWGISLNHSLVDNGTWKKAVLGNGHASKEEIANFAIGVLGLNNGLEQDFYDAACIAQYGRIATQ